MNIINFTPISALMGGVIIGFAILLFFLFKKKSGEIWELDITNYNFQKVPMSFKYSN